MLAEQGLEDRLRSRAAETLAAIVPDALGEPSARVEAWRHEVIGASLGLATGGLYRLSGVAGSRAGDRPWAVVLKIVRPPRGTRHDAGARDPAHWAYWQREPLAYGSGLLAELPDGLAAPRCLALHCVGPEEVWLWLEAVDDRAGRHWSKRHFVRAARRLGAFNGASLRAQPLPLYPWLGDAYLEQRIRRADADGGLPLFADQSGFRHASLRSVCPPQIGEQLQALWAQRHAIVGALAQLPSGVRHGDAHRSNLLISRRDAGRGRALSLTAVDWGTVGYGPPGADLADLVLGWLSGGQGEPSLPAGSPAAAERMYEAYLEGLGDGGWRGEASLVRLGYAGTISLVGASRLHWTLTRALGAIDRNGIESAAVAALLGQLTRWKWLTRYLLRLGREAANVLGAP
jgi:hypothetical protein